MGKPETAQSLFLALPVPLLDPDPGTNADCKVSSDLWIAVFIIHVKILSGPGSLRGLSIVQLYVSRQMSVVLGTPRYYSRFLLL